MSTNKESKNVKIYLLNRQYTIADFSIILLNALGIELIDQNGDQNKVFQGIKKRIKDAIYMFESDESAESSTIEEGKRNVLFDCETFVNLLSNQKKDMCDKTTEQYIKKLHEYLEKITGSEITWKIIQQCDRSILKLNQEKYTLHSFVILFGNHYGISLREINGKLNYEHKSINQYLRRKLTTKEYYKKEELNKILKSAVIWATKNNYIRDDFDNIALSNASNNQLANWLSTLTNNSEVKNALVDLLINLLKTDRIKSTCKKLFK